MCLVGSKYNFIPLLNVTSFPVVRFDRRPKTATAYTEGKREVLQVLFLIIMLIHWLAKQQQIKYTKNNKQTHKKQ
jgi:hypothetical protein